MLKPQKDTIIPAIQIAKKEYEVKKKLAASLYFYLSTHGGNLQDVQKYQDVKTELMDLQIHIEVLEELAKDAK